MATKARSTVSAEESITADLIALMESATLAPWRRPWAGEEGQHRNLLSGDSYRGSNPILLEIGALLRGHTLPLGLGAGQAKANDWWPQKGCKAVRIVRPQLNKREVADDAGKAVMQADGSPSIASWVSFKPVCVFNAADLVGATPEATAKLEATIAAALGQAPQFAAPAARLDAAETRLEAWVVPTHFGGAKACYSPSLDVIGMPSPEVFTSREAYCATWAHEQAHSTGHKSRLDRQFGQLGPSDKAYAKEELIAELSSVLICYRLQIGCELQGHAAYLHHWAQVLREEPKALFKILSAARQAADLIAPEAPLSVEIVAEVEPALAA